MGSLARVPTILWRLVAPRVVGVAIVVVLCLAVASWVAGDVARNYAIGRLHAENDVLALQADIQKRQALESEAIGRRHINPVLRRAFVDSKLQLTADLLHLHGDERHRAGTRRIEHAYARAERALANELAAIQRGEIAVALSLDAQATDPAAAALDDLLGATRLQARDDSDWAAGVAGLIGWMKAIVAALAIGLLVRRAARSRAQTAKAEAEAEVIAELNRRLRESDRIKDEFVATVSHELRTPLTSIRGYLELLLGEEAGLSEQGRDFLAVIDRNSKRLLSLVTDLLFLAQADGDQFELKIAPFHPGELVDEAVASAQPHAAAQQVALFTRVDDVPEVAGDRARLAQMLDNLVSNALKFTPPGGSVEVRLLRDADGSTVLEVADTGIGIPQAEQKMLFERFFRSTTATKNFIVGTGLGLSIVKLTAEAHGGTLSVESVEGKGTTFRVVLPLPLETLPAAA
jgi:signal transduction histidine kinase